MIALHLSSIQLEDVRLRAQAAGAGKETVLVGGRAAANLVKDHLFGLDSTRPNALGGKRTHFYASAAKSVSNPKPTGAGVSFTINQIGLAQRWLGGTIRAGAGISSATGRATQYLAIPARAESYGKAPSEFPDLRFVPRKGGGMLIQALQTAIKWTKKGAEKAFETGGGVMFWLVKEVTQRPDPTVLPTEDAIEHAAASAMESYLTRRLAGQT